MLIKNRNGVLLVEKGKQLPNVSYKRLVISMDGMHPLPPGLVDGVDGDTTRVKGEHTNRTHTNCGIFNEGRDGVVLKFQTEGVFVTVSLHSITP